MASTTPQQATYEQDFIIYRYSAFLAEIKVNPSDPDFSLEGWEALLEVRDPDDLDRLYLRFTRENGSIQFGHHADIQTTAQTVSTKGTSEDPRIMRLVMTAADTARISWQQGIYTLLLRAPGGMILPPLYKGTFTVEQGVSRWPL